MIESARGSEAPDASQHDAVRVVAELTGQVLCSFTPQGELVADSPSWRGFTGQSWTVQASCAPGGPDEYAFDFRVIWPDGSIHWLAVSGQVTARDATGRATLVRGRSST
jgi:hypothetical protein